ncbi:uncharacterized protein LOC135116297 [Scylla paramamosain]|uniref:uncharacterized protein LOC135116297 n=1 Tax=Scylla paramamosain TaxID=85552 RepID=UPI003082B3F6
MAKITVIWMTVWASSSFAATTQVDFLSSAMQGICVTMSPLTTYHMHTASNTLCAMLCARKGAPKFAFTSGNTCILYGEGRVLNSFTHTFLTLPPPDSLEDVATGKNARGSSVYEYKYIPSKAVDIETDETKNTMYHSQREKKPWWLLDLGEIRTIHAVEIISRQDCCPERLHDVEIRVGNYSSTDFSHYTLFSTYAGPYSVDQGRLSCVKADGVSGRFVAILKVKQPPIPTPLQLVDVNVLVRKW